MYVPIRDESRPLNIKIPWDSNTARGFIIALIIIAVFLLLVPHFEFSPPEVRDASINIVPLEIISFGDGDGTGVSKGNLSEEGMKHQGKATNNPLEDASVAGATKIVKNATTDDVNNASNFIAKKELSSNEKSNNPSGSGSKNTGSPGGTPGGTGLGDKGSGPGAGLGLGDIEWGGGGNRTVLYKKLPKYPAGSNTNATIRIRFIVGTDGTVTSMVPLQKGDPMLEKAAMDALRQWRFNPLSVNKDMVGIITFTFRVS
ncbi:MAG: TonB family protein [Bacteroidota bacterium]